MTPSPPKLRAKFKLDDLYFMVAAIYAEQNAQRSPSSTFAHFVEVCGMLTIHDRKKKREGFGIEDALCKALGWFFPLMAKFRVISVEDLVFRKYPYACPYCRELPHKDAICKTTRGSDSTVDHDAVMTKVLLNKERRPRGLNEWQQMFDDIYPRDAATLGTGRSIMGLFEELGELAEAIRVFDKHPKYFAGEAADVFSYLMGIANEHRVRAQVEESPIFDFEAVFLRKYPGMCVQCGNHVCICPSIPESTVGRLAKEIEISASEQLFGLNSAAADKRGKEIGESVLNELGGLPAIAHQLPLDRGEANQALVLLCLKLSNEVQPKDEELAKSLREAAIRIASDTRTPGSRAHGAAPGEVLELLTSVMYLN